MAYQSKYSEVLERNKTLADCYVYYKRLETDFPDDSTARAVNNNIINAVNEGIGSSNANLIGAMRSVSSLKRLAKTEAQKEQQLLNKVFGANVTVDWSDRAQIKNLIDTYNECLNLKEVYERNLFLIKNSEGMKGVFSYFPSYFQSELDRQWPRIFSEKIEPIFNLEDPYGTIKKIQEILNESLSQITIIALENMLGNSKTELKSMPAEMRNAYKSFLNEIKSFKDEGSIAQRIYKIYHLERVSEFLTKELTGENLRDSIQTLTKDKVKGLWRNNGAQEAGLFLEELVDIAQARIAKQLGGKTYHTSAYGATNISADNILTFGIDGDLLEQTLLNAHTKTVQEHIKTFNELGEKLKDVKDGFIIYTTDKNYTLNKKFERQWGGYSAKSLKAGSVIDVLAPIVKNVRTLVGLALQLGEGALAKENGTVDEDVLAQNFAKQIAYFLFDDHDTIGEIQNDMSVKSIHMMDLNGVMVPLSFFISLLADSIEKGIMNPNKLVRVDIKAPRILYLQMKDQVGVDSPWGKQKQYALNNTIINFHFLSGIKDILNMYA